MAPCLSRPATRRRWPRRCSRLLDDPQAAARLAAAARARAALLPSESAAVDQALGLYQRVR